MEFTEVSLAWNEKMEKNRQHIKNCIGAFFANIAVSGTATTLISSFASYLLTDLYGLSAAIVGMVLSVSVLIDGVSDFLMGFVMDLVTTRHGKARHWLLWMAIPLAVLTGVVFIIPAGFHGIAVIIYFFVVYNLFNTALTAVRLPVTALPALLTNDIGERTTISFASAFAAVAGPMVIANLIAPTVNMFPDEKAGYAVLNIIMAVLTAVFLVIAYFLVREQGENGREWEKRHAEKRDKKEKNRAVSMLLALFKNEKWIRRL